MIIVNKVWSIVYVIVLKTKFGNDSMFWWVLRVVRIAGVFLEKSLGRLRNILPCGKSVVV